MKVSKFLIDTIIDIGRKKLFQAPLKIGSCAVFTITSYALLPYPRQCVHV